MDIDWKTELNAPPSGTIICALNALEQGKITEFEFGEGEPFRLIVYLADGNVHCFVNRCPHHWIRMCRDDGEFKMWDAENHEMMCIHHCAVFQLTQHGNCIDGPCKGSNLTEIPIEVVDGYVVIRNVE